MGNKKDGPFKKTWKNLRWQWNITIWGHMLMGDTSSNGWFSSVMFFFLGGIYIILVTGGHIVDFLVGRFCSLFTEEFTII